MRARPSASASSKTLRPSSFSRSLLTMVIAASSLPCLLGRLRGLGRLHVVCLVPLRDVRLDLLHDLGPDLSDVADLLAQDGSREVLALGADGQEDVLGAHVVVPEAQRLLDHEVSDEALRSWRERQRRWRSLCRV